MLKKNNEFQKILNSGEMKKIVGGLIPAGGTCAEKGQTCDADSNKEGIHCCPGKNLICDSGESAKCITKPGEA